MMHKSNGRKDTGRSILSASSRRSSIYSFDPEVKSKELFDIIGENHKSDQINLNKLRKELFLLGIDKEKFRAVNSMFNDGITLLMKAIICDYDLEIIDKLTTATTVNFPNLENGTTSLMYAAISGRTKVIKILNEKGVDIKEKDKHGKTAFELAAEHGHKDFLEAMLAHFKDISEDEKIKALLSAALHNHDKAVDFLLNKIDCNTLDENLHTPLMLAVKAECTQLTLDLWQKTSNTLQKNKEGCTALMLAVINGQHEIIKKITDLHLIKSNVDNFYDKTIGWFPRVKRFIAPKIESLTEAILLTNAFIHSRNAEGKLIVDVLYKNTNVRKKEKILTLGLLKKQPQFYIDALIEGKFNGLVEPDDSTIPSNDVPASDPLFTDTVSGQTPSDSSTNLTGAPTIDRDSLPEQATSLHQQVARTYLAR